MALFIYAAALTTAHLLGSAIEIPNRPNSAHAALQNGLHPFSLCVRGNDNTTTAKNDPYRLRILGDFFLLLLFFLVFLEGGVGEEVVMVMVVGGRKSLYVDA